MSSPGMRSLVPDEGGADAIVDVDGNAIAAVVVFLGGARNTREAPTARDRGEAE